MNLTFAKPEIETIKRLTELCEKNGYEFVFGFNCWADGTADTELIDRLMANGILGGYEFSYTETGAKFWLELRKDGKIDNLVFTETAYTFEGSHVHGEYGDTHEDSEYTVASTFDLKDESVHLRYPYRWGVVLGSYANHVAKKLGEPDLFKDIVY